MPCLARGCIGFFTDPGEGKTQAAHNAYFRRLTFDINGMPNACPLEGLGRCRKEHSAP